MKLNSNTYNIVLDFFKRRFFELFGLILVGFFFLFIYSLIDYSPEGKKANLNLNYAPQTYSYSVAASELKHLPSAYKDRQNKPLMAEKLHAEHVIPNNMVFSRLVELADSGSSNEELASFLRESRG